MEPETLQSVLQDAGIQVDKKNLENPTEEFMVYLITEYLNKLNLDGNEICKCTPDQLECTSCPDSALDAIKILNLYSALSSFCKEIFLNGLYLTDITSPGPKRACRQIKILFNFFAYVRNKITENEMAVVELDNQQKDIENMVDQKNSIIAKIGATINDRENKIELKEQIQKEIDEISIIIKNNNKRSKELEYKVKDVMVQHQEAYKKCGDLKAKAMELHKVTTDLQSKIVKSPEEYATRCKELKDVLEVKKEERQVLNDSITRKRLQIKNNENAQELVKDLNDKFSINTTETFQHLKETVEKLDSVQKEIEILKIDIATCTNIDINNKNSKSEETDLKEHDKLLFELNNQYSDKEREFQTQKSLLEELKSELNKKKCMLEDELKTILQVEEENSDLINRCKKDFQNDVEEEFTLREVISRELLKTHYKTI